MKLLFVLFFSLFTCAVNAQETVSNSCATNLVDVSDWSQIAGPTINCLNASADFSSGITTLCEADKSQLTSQYIQYLKYQKNYQDAVAEFQAMPTPTAAAKNKVNQAKMDWEILGNRPTMSIVINKVKTAFAKCSGAN